MVQLHMGAPLLLFSFFKRVSFAFRMKYCGRAELNLAAKHAKIENQQVVFTFRSFRLFRGQFLFRRLRCPAFIFCLKFDFGTLTCRHVRFSQ